MLGETSVLTAEHAVWHVINDVGVALIEACGEDRRDREYQEPRSP